MKISVLVIAHNEEKYIRECIESLLRQTKKADEIVLILHNSTDQTRIIAEKYPIKLILYDGPAGIVHARLEGLQYVAGDIILCIDGDSYAEENWVEEMSRVLEKGNVLVGSQVKFKGTLFGALSNILNGLFTVSKGEKAASRIWGPSFAFWAKDKEKIKNIFKDSILLTQHLNLTRNPDDYWLALFMSKVGNLEVTDKTWVINHTKETTSLAALWRNVENLKNGRKMLAFFKVNHP